MSIRVFEELEMEFFDPKDELPASHERVMIILKAVAQNLSMLL